MKKFLSFLALSALVLGLGSCTKDDARVDVSGTSVSFAFAKPQDAYVTRAGGDIATDNEWFIETVDIYAATGSRVTKLTVNEDYTLTSGVRAYTLAMTTDWIAKNASKEVNFYFVGNDAISDEGAHTSLTTTNENAFRNALANELGITDGKSNLIAVDPATGDNLLDGATRGLLFSTVIEGVKITGKVQRSSTFRRREARFDIKKPKVSSGDDFVVTEILVSQASTTGPVFHVANLQEDDIPKRSHVRLVGPSNGTEAEGYADGDYNLTDLTAPAVFYLYPTELSSVPGDGKTEIVVMAKIGDGDPVPYVANASSIRNQILANFRYILELDPDKPEFLIVRSDYDPGDTHPFVPGTDDVIAIDPADVDAAVGDFFTAPTKTFVVTDNEEHTLTFDVSSYYGTEGIVEYISGGAPAPTVVKLEQFKPVATYAQHTYVDSYTITIPAQSGGFEARVIVRSPGGMGADTIAVRKLWGGDASAILYIAEDGKLSKGSWAEIQAAGKQDSIAFFKFGSVIGFDNMRQGDPVSGDVAWNPDMSAIKFNPSALVVGTDIAEYATIPGFVRQDWTDGIRNVSAADYATVANVRAGKGDPCMLIGYSGAEIAAMSDSDLQAVLDGAQWRLPTVLENSAFVGGPDLPFDESEMPATGFWKSWVPFQSPAYLNYIYATTAWGAAAATEPRTVNEGHPYDYYTAKLGTAAGLNEAGFPVVANYNAVNSLILPAAGYRSYTSGGVTNQGANGDWWSSTPASTTNGHRLGFYGNNVYPVNSSNSADGFSIRCVTTSYDAGKVPTAVDPDPTIPGTDPKPNQTTLVFDKTLSDPANITGAGRGGIRNIISKMRRVLVKPTASGEVTIAYLDNDNSNLYADGTPAALDGTQGDVMVYKPAFYYKYESIDADHFSYTISEDDLGSGSVFSPASLIGAYKSTIVGSAMYSRSGATPTSNVTWTDNNAAAQARGTGYNMIDFEQHSMIALLFYAKYGNRDSQAILGMGGATSSANNTTGSTNSIGNADTKNETASYVSFAGIEGVYGGFNEWVSGVSIDNTTGTWTITNLDGSTRQMTTAVQTNTVWITKMAFENPAAGGFFDPIPTEASGGSETTYYADVYEYAVGPNRVFSRSHHSTSNAGVSYAHTYRDASTPTTAVASRLAFRGVIEAVSPAEFKAIPMTLPSVSTAHTPGQADILYFDGTSLAIGKWGTEITAADYLTKMVFFQFGSIVGMDNDGANNSPWAGNADIKFNPTGGDYTNYAAIPLYDATVVNKTPLVSGAAYHTFINIKAGKGDPCQLIGLTAAQIAAASSEAELVMLLNARPAAQKGWRLPTVLENKDFVGGPAAASWDGTKNYNYRTSAWAGDANTENMGSPYDYFTAGTPGVAKFPVTANGDILAFSQTLPAAGYRTHTTGVVTYQGTYGRWWSSTPASATNGHNLGFNSSNVYPVYSNAYSYGFSVRCVKPAA